MISPAKRYSLPLDISESWEKNEPDTSRAHYSPTREALSVSQIALTVKKERLLFQGGKEENVEMNQ